MSTYVIGDVQGCHGTLLRLVRRIRFDAKHDRLWFVGDLVNRGAASLQVLRWVRDRADRATVVLGNHDLHLLARAAGVAAPRRRDTLADVLEAPDREELLAWLRARPLLHRQGDHLLVHAGLLPGWTAEVAAKRARAAERELRGGSGRSLLRSLDRGPRPESAGRGAVHTLAVLTRMRACRPDGKMVDGFTGPVDEVPPGCHPWFRVPGRRSAGVTVVFGHWAMLGLVQEPGLIALDTGCVYGGPLTAVRLEDGALFQEPNAEP